MFGAGGDIQNYAFAQITPAPKKNGGSSMDSYSGETNPLMEQIINKIKQDFSAVGLPYPDWYITNLFINSRMLNS